MGTESCLASNNDPISETAKWSSLRCRFATGEQINYDAVLVCYISTMHATNYNKNDITPIVYAKADKIQGVTLQKHIFVLLDSGNTSTLVKRIQSV